jgi:tetratricopeptide (TPR) repeat protein
MLFKMNGKFHEAKEMFAEVVDAYTQIYGFHHPSTLNALINLATTHKDLNEYDLAVEKYEQAIEGRMATEGDNSVNFAMAKAMAAGAYRELN